MAETLAVQYLLERNGSVPDYIDNLYIGQRVGQAFFNALSADDRARLTGRPQDPFYKNDSPSIYAAIEYLLDTEDGWKEWVSRSTL